MDRCIVQRDVSSRTAEYAAAFRALESTRWPARSRLFEDPFAVLFLSRERRRLVRLAGLPLLGAVVRSWVDRRWPGAMTSGIVRTRLIDDHLRQALRDGIAQVLLLGAGYDCRAYRMPELERCRVVEVDHPATQAVKRERLLRILGALPSHVAFVGTDLTREDPRRTLGSAGLVAGERVFVVWEGVTHYIGETAVDGTLRAVAETFAPASRMVFTYLDRGVLDGTRQFEGARASIDAVAGDGEPWIWGMDPGRMPDFLAERGLRLLEDVGADEYRARYWGERGRRMRGFGFYRVALAELRSLPAVARRAKAG